MISDAGYENNKIKHMIRRMIKDELRIDIYDSMDGVTVTLFLGDDEIQREVFGDIHQWSR